MHSFESAERRIDRLLEGKESFIELSRDLAEKAQRRESVTTQPKEHLTGEKAKLTIKNYLGGYYYLTCDEAEVRGTLISGHGNSDLRKLPWCLIVEWFQMIT